VINLKGDDELRPIEVVDLTHGGPLEGPTTASHKLPPVIAVLGPPASGKSLICSQLTRQFRVCHIDIDEWLFDATRRPIDGVPETIAALMAAGQPIPKKTIVSEFAGRGLVIPWQVSAYRFRQRGEVCPASFWLQGLRAKLEDMARTFDYSSVLLENFPSSAAVAQASFQHLGADWLDAVVMVRCPRSKCYRHWAADGRSHTNSHGVELFPHLALKFESSICAVIGLLSAKVPVLEIMNTEPVAKFEEWFRDEVVREMRAHTVIRGLLRPNGSPSGRPRRADSDVWWTGEHGGEHVGLTED
jgi:hypothetical protein